jgi:hypothetical protein
MSGMSDLNKKLFYFAPQTRLMNPGIDPQAKNFQLHNKILLEKDAE